MSKEVRFSKQKYGPLPEHSEPVENPINNAVTRNHPKLVELQPEMFATISPGLANKLGAKQWFRNQNILSVT